MKNLYKCERCGKVSEDYEKILKCEQMHYIFSNAYTSDSLDQTLNAMAEYKEDQEEPQIIHVWLTRSYWDGDTWKEEKRCGKYKLISSYEAPLVVENE